MIALRPCIAAGWATLMALAAPAHGQSAARVDQIGQASTSSVIAVDQIAPTAKDRDSGATPAPKAHAAPPAAELDLAPRRRPAQSSVDAEDIARVLNAGEAVTIDAAAAIASGAVATPPDPQSEPESEPNRAARAQASMPR